MIKRLAVIADPLESIRAKGIDEGLSRYFNPAGFFDEVYFLSPDERTRSSCKGFEVIPARDVALPGLLRRLGIDVVRAYGGRWPAEMAVFFRAPNVPAVVSIHDRRPELLYPAVRWADIVLCVSAQARAQVLRYHSSPDRVWLRPNGVDLAQMKALPAAQWALLDSKYPLEQIILHIGRKSPEKNIETLINALTFIPSGTGLVMIGPGDDSALRRLAEAKGVLSRCVFIETIPNIELPVFYNWADCFCLPSLDEAMSNVVLEAMACGCPMVLSAASAAGVGIENGKEALIVDDPRSPEALACLILRVLEDKTSAADRGANAAIKAAQYDGRITAKKEAEQYQLIFEMRDSGLFEQPLLHIAARKADQYWTRLTRRIAREFKQ